MMMKARKSDNTAHGTAGRAACLVINLLLNVNTAAASESVIDGVLAVYSPSWHGYWQFLESCDAEALVNYF
jgi:hypothetical protein